jgi:hypothetical protein
VIPKFLRGLEPSGWMMLSVPRFKCGHEKTPQNSHKAGQWTRCKTCQTARTKRWYQENR